jgi:hypothetical protein
MILSDLNLNQPLPIQLSQVTNYVVINDPAFPPLSTIVVNGYDAYGNALSAVQVFPRTAKLVRYINEAVFNTSIPNPIQLSQVTNYVPLYNDDATFPALSTTVVEGYNAYGNPIVHTQIFPRTVSLVIDVTTSLNVTAPEPIQLSQVANYVQVIDEDVDPLSCVVVNGYDAYGNAISAVQIFSRQLQIVKEVDNINWNQTAANPIQLSQVTNYCQLYNNDINFPALSTTVVNGYDAYGNPLSSVQVIPRTASLVYKISPSTVLDYSAPNPIQLSQVGNYVPLYNDDTNYPALSTVVINGYDAYGNAISAVQVYPRMVSLVLDYNSGLNTKAPLYFEPINQNVMYWSPTYEFQDPTYGPLDLQTFSAVSFAPVVSLKIISDISPSTTLFIDNISSYQNLKQLWLQGQPVQAITSILTPELPNSVTTLDLYGCQIGNSFTQQYKPQLHVIENLHLWADGTITILDVSGLSALQYLQLYALALSTLNVEDCNVLNTITINYCNQLLDFNLDNLSAIEALQIGNCPSLSGFEEGQVTTLVDFEILNCPLSGELDLTQNTQLNYVIVVNTSLSSISIPPTIGTSNYAFENNNLTQNSVDRILSAAAVGAVAGAGSYLNVDGTGNSYPSSVGYTAISTLTANNWNVVFNAAP